MKIENADDVEYHHVFHWVYLHELAQKRYLKISANDNDIIQVWEHEKSCKWMKTTYKLSNIEYVTIEIL